MWGKISQKWNSSSSSLPGSRRNSIEPNDSVASNGTPVKKSPSSAVDDFDYDEQLGLVFLRRKKDLLEAMKDARKVKFLNL
jgi:hypothetical protein